VDFGEVSWNRQADAIMKEKKLETYGSVESVMEKLRDNILCPAGCENENQWKGRTFRKPSETLKENDFPIFKQSAGKPSSSL